MKLKKLVFAAAAVCSFFTAANSVSAQGTTFSYQGRLNQSGSPASGSYDLRFAVYDAMASGNQIGAALTNSATAVSNGLFTVALDFGGVFTGTNYWLQIATRTNGGGAFTTLIPRQPFMPTPYAIMANSASNLLGLLPAIQLTGTVPTANLPMNFTNGQAISNLLATVQFALNVANLGVTNDGTTDVTAKLQNLLNQGGAFYFPAGRYLARELYITNNTTLIGSGATLVYATAAANSNIFVTCGLNNNITILGMTFDGGDYSEYTTRKFTTYAGVQDFSVPYSFAMWNPLGVRHGLQINIDGGGLISGITISGFGGIGLLPVSPKGINGPGFGRATVSGVYCISNFVGLFSSGMIGVAIGPYLPNWITNYIPGAKDPEFMSYSGLNLIHNTIGMSASAGNCTYVNSAFTANLFGQLDSNGNNDHHGSINSCEYTHNTAMGIYISGCQFGEQIINCQFRDNGASITLDHSAGITVDFSTFAPLIITNTGSIGQNFFRHNTYPGTWASQTFIADGKTLYFGNNSYDTPGDNDGQLLTLLGTGTVHGLSTNIQFTFNGTRTNTLYFTNGILSAVTQP